MNDWTRRPTLVGKHVRLEPLTPDHAAGLYEAGSDPVVWTWLSGFRPETTAEAGTMVADILGDPDRLAFAQVDVRTGAVAGTTSYYAIVPKHRILSIGHTWIGKPWQRTALNTEAKLLLLHHAFDELEANRVSWETDLNNTRSQRAIERLGATKEGVLRAHRVRKDGSIRDTVLYSVTKTEWPFVRDSLAARLG
ncbi:GNAT family N-acetyltransferase [Amycolatopsis sp. YIM 10]|uniref:GNAT family N-acetyltransferase n=1 Tax=Amycolatopsis sp. YIM 10 TaxID=2653857 RepID=UPI00128FD5F3|nr:GNAT family protein [Amycolatopsis sp. YIM 10]QFU85687.1 Putative ribosomal N-acetyltransferase YdaF [Amycolatopsis sp. YIM 10]